MYSQHPLYCFLVLAYSRGKKERLHAEIIAHFEQASIGFQLPQTSRSTPLVSRHLNRALQVRPVVAKEMLKFGLLQVEFQFN